MIVTIITAAAIYLFILFVWVFYLAVMNMKSHLSTMTRFAKVNGYVVVGIGLLLDALLHFVIGTIVFLDLPREVLLTRRLKRYRRQGRYMGTWRRSLGNWLCYHLLDQFDPSGEHC